VDFEGTYPLPEAQLDRFLMKIRVAYPSEAEELQILERHHGGSGAGLLEDASIAPIPDGLLAAACAEVRVIRIEPELYTYILALARRTRAVYDSQGHFMGGFGVITDITAIKNLEKEVLDVTERERQKIGYELHDDLGQHLIGIDVMTKVLRDKIIPLSDENARYAGEINQLVKGAIEKTRCLARGLCPVHLTSLGLESSLEELADSTSSIFNMNCSFRCPRHIPIHDNSLATHLYYIAKESIHNAIEHGKSSKIVMELLNNNGIVSLSILDNGVGIKDTTKVGGIGLRIMRYRARVIGATLNLKSEPNQGTQIVVQFNRKSAENGNQSK